MECGGLNENGPNSPIGYGTISMCGFVGLGVALVSVNFRGMMPASYPHFTTVDSFIHHNV